MNQNLKRVHGGVVLVDTRDDLEYMFELKFARNVELKKRLAVAAAELVQNGDSLIIDSGSTCLYAAMELHNKTDLRVVTLDVKIAEELAKYDNIESIIIGGVIRPGYYTVGESIAESMLDQFAVDKAILSADAVDIAQGITNYSVFEVGVKKRMIEKASEVILIADHTKFGKTSFYKVADLSTFSTIISTDGLLQEYIDGIVELGINLLLV